VFDMAHLGTRDTFGEPRRSDKQARVLEERDETISLRSVHRTHVNHAVAHRYRRNQRMRQEHRFLVPD